MRENVRSHLKNASPSCNHLDSGRSLQPLDKRQIIGHISPWPRYSGRPLHFVSWRHLTAKMAGQFHCTGARLPHHPFGGNDAAAIITTKCPVALGWLLRQQREGEEEEEGSSAVL